MAENHRSVMVDVIMPEGHLGDFTVLILEQYNQWLLNYCLEMIQMDGARQDRQMTSISIVLCLMV